VPPWLHIRLNTSSVFPGTLRQPPKACPTLCIGSRLPAISRTCYVSLGGAWSAPPHPRTRVSPAKAVIDIPLRTPHSN
ncbi:MAG: hypothetical protein ACK55I_43660, partial [bacterium]